MTALDQSMARDKQRMTLAKCYFLFFAIWIAFVSGIMLAGIDLNPLLDFGFGAVTGGLMMKMGDIIQFFFRTSGDKPSGEVISGQDGVKK